MTREQAWRIVQASYLGRPVDPAVLVPALNKINYRHKARARLHPLPADVRARVNMVLMFNLGKAIAQCVKNTTVEENK